MNADSHDTLDWLAQQYVLRELSAEEQARFEERLLDDQAAREAVAEAVLLTQLTAEALRESRAPAQTPPAEIAPAETARAQPAPSRSAAGEWAAVAGGIALLLALVLLWLGGARELPGPARKADPELARVWVEIIDEHAARDVATNDGALTESVSEPLEVTEPVDLTVEAPDWMLAAVSNLAREGRELQHEQDMENR